MRIISIIFAFIFFASIVHAQNTTVIASLDTNVIKLGEQTTFSIKATFSKGNKITFPFLKDTITEKIEIVRALKTDTILINEEYLTITKNYLVTSFDKGNWVIPPLQLIINNDSSKAIETEALLLNVETVSVDTTKAIKPIKAPYDAPLTFKELIPYIAGGLGLVALIFIIVLLVRKYAKKKPKEIIVNVPKISNYEIAVNKLKEIEKNKMWQEGLIKEYHSAIADTLREYIESEFKIKALEQTTNQTKRSLRHITIISNEIKHKLIQVLELADMVKFAKELPIQHEHELSLNNAFEFLNDCNNTLTQPKAKNE